MGVAPPKDALPPEEQSAVDADAGFEPSPTGPSLCGFGIPLFTFNFQFRLPFTIPPFPPDFNFSIALNCDLSNPVDADFGFGGGRVGKSDPDPDDEFE